MLRSGSILKNLMNSTDWSKPYALGARSNYSQGKAGTVGIDGYLKPIFRKVAVPDKILLMNSKIANAAYSRIDIRFGPLESNESVGASLPSGTTSGRIIPSPLFSQRSGWDDLILSTLLFVKP